MTLLRQSSRCRWKCGWLYSKDVLTFLCVYSKHTFYCKMKRHLSSNTNGFFVLAVKLGVWLWHIVTMQLVFAICLLFVSPGRYYGRSAKFMVIEASLFALGWHWINMKITVSAESAWLTQSDEKSKFSQPGADNKMFHNRSYMCAWQFPQCKRNRTKFMTLGL